MSVTDEQRLSAMGMSFFEYQKEARRTLDPSAQLAIMGLGLAGEAGEVVEMLKKHLGHGHELPKKMLAKELGDVLWYVAAIATLTGLDLEDVAVWNIIKLQQRYPGGFSHERSINREG